MGALRHRLIRQRWVAAWLIVLALAMRVLVPSGYMLVTAHGSITLELCSGSGPQTMATAMRGMAHHGGKQGGHSKAELPCAFAGLSAPSLAAADPLLLATAIAFVLLTVFRIAARPALPGAPLRLRPPLRGPPAHA